jgi:uncharacterized repeat protein (TIGR01451 family)
MKRIWNFGCALGVLAGAVAHAVAADVYIINAVGFASGGGVSSGGGYTLGHTVGEPFVGDSGGGGYTLGAGFWAQDNDGVSGSNVDLAVSVGALPAQIHEGDILTIPITVSNLGPDSATSVQLSFSVPNGAILQSVTNDYGSAVVQGSNVICSVAALAPQQRFNVRAVLSVDPVFASQTGGEFYDWSDIIWTFRASAAELDPFPSNNVASAAVVVVIPNLDFGDARFPYPVTRAENGARHRNGTVYHMGANFDRESDGVHSANANADDLAGAPPDEDGVVLPSGAFVAGHTHTITVTVPVAGYLDSFFDFNNDGDWNDPGERVTPASGLLIGPGAIPVPVVVPPNAVTGSPHARFRFSDVGGLAPTNFHSVGEVVDRQVEIRRMDFGSAPDPVYRTLLANDGARHVVDPAFKLGATLDWEGDAFDSLDGDGVVFLTPLTPGTVASVRVSASVAGKLDAFIDFDGDGVWSERITLAAGTPLLAGINDVSFTVPAAATEKSTWARFRFSDTGGLAPTGPADIGEVEDYQVTISPASVLVFGGFEHTPFGGATMTASATSLTISNLNSTNDLVRINLNEAEGWRGDITFFDPNHDCMLFTTRGSSGGQSNQPLHSVHVDRNGSNVVVRPNFAGLGASSYVTEFYDQNGVLLLSRAPAANDTSLSFGLCPPGTRAVCQIKVFADSIYILVCDCVEIPGLSTNVPGGIVIKMSAVGATAIVDYLSAVDIGGTTPITISNEAVQKFGLFHTAIGSPRLAPVGSIFDEVEDFELNVVGTTSYGVSTELDDNNALSLSYRGPNGLRLSEPATEVRFELGASESNNLAVVCLTNLAISADFSSMGVSSFLLEVLGSQSAGSATVNGNALATLASQSGGTVDFWDFDWWWLTPPSSPGGRLSKGLTDGVVWQFGFHSPVVVTPTGHAPLVGDVLRITAVSTGAVAKVARFDQLFTGFPAVKFFMPIRDYGDAPTGYPVTKDENGASHSYAANWRLGSKWDREFNGVHSANSDYDDTNGSTDDDEDGVVVTTATGGIQLRVTAAVDGYFDGWIDLNRNFSWGDPGEQVATSVPLTAGVATYINVSVPGGTAAGQFFSRWRLSATGGLSYTNYGGKGEVEDVVINWQPESVAYDFGDAPDTYKTLLANMGAYHTIVAGWKLGANIDSESDGLPSADANGDDVDGSDDEDGFGFTTSITPGAMATVQVNVSVPAGFTGYVNGWMDFQRNGSWIESEDHIVSDYSVTGAAVPTVLNLNFLVPASAKSGPSYARFRLSPVAGISFTDGADAGEVEDKGFQCQLLDFGDAPDTYRTSASVDGPRHVPIAQFCLGSLIDVESDGFPSANADGDDLDQPLGYDDEDGVSLVLFVPGTMVNFEVTATVPGGTPARLDAWIDWNKDGVFNETDERIAAARPINNGVNTIGVNVPSGASNGTTYARFRLSTVGGLPSFGLASDGEVEDYLVTVSSNAVPDLVIASSAISLSMVENIAGNLTLGATNRGPNTASNVQLSARAPAGLRILSATSSVGSCQITGASNVVCTAGNLASNASFNVVLSLRPNFLAETSAVTMNLGNLTASVGGVQLDPNSGNNAVAVPVVVTAQLDFGDARGGFPVTLAENGARHRYSPTAPWLGIRWDNDTVGNHSPLADFDDTHGASDDEDGVVVVPPLYRGMSATVQVTATAPGFIDVWADFNNDTDWADADEQIFASQSVVAGVNTLTFNVPSSAVAGLITTRWRISTTGGLSYGGYGGVGEVEDHMATIAIPPVLDFAGLSHASVGNAALNVSSNGLQITSLNSTNDGVRISLGRAEGWRAELLNPAPLSNAIRLTATGTVNGQSNQSLGSLRMERIGFNATFTVGFGSLGASQYVARFYNSTGALLASTSPTSVSTSLRFPNCDDDEILVCRWETIGTRWRVYICNCIELPDGIDVPGPIIVEMSAVSPAVNAAVINEVTITGAAGSLNFADEAVRQLNLWQRFVSGALLDTADTNSSATLRVGNLGASGQAGVETIVGGSDYIGELPAGNLFRQRVVQFWCCWDDWFLTSSNSHIRWTATGPIQGSTNEFETLSDLTAFKQEQGTRLTTRFDAIGATQALVEVFNGPALVGSVTLAVGDLGTLSTGAVRGVTVQVIDNTLVGILTGAEPWNFQPANGSPALTGDRFRITALNPTSTVEGLRSLITRGANVESFALKSFNTAAPQRLRLSMPRLTGGGEVTIPISTEPDVSYDLERSPTVNGPWTTIGRVMGTDGTNETSFFDINTEVSFFYRTRVR